MATTTSVIFPNTVYVVFNDTLSSFISATTVSPSVPGTFAFFKNNSSGAALTSASVFDAVGSYTIFCQFTPTDTVTYQTSSSTAFLVVQDLDVYNSYFNIPVSDASNVLVNGNFNYIPASIASGTSVSAPTNVPGWNFYKTGSYDIQLVNNVDISLGITYPPPFASTTTKVVYFVGGYLFQWFYAPAGVYQFSAYYAAPATSANYIWFNIDSTSSAYRSSTPYPNLQNWQLYTTTVTITTTGMHRFVMTTNGTSKFYAACLSLKPVSSPFYLMYSKINSQLFNGTFESEVQTTNSKTLSPLTNWNIVSNNVWVLNNYSTYTSLPYPYPSGNQCIAIEGLGKITQTFNYVSGTSNYLSFYICGITDTSVNAIRVSMNSTVIFDSNSVIVSSTGINSGSWQKMVFKGITTVDGANTLTIEGRNSGTNITAIDNVTFGSIAKQTPVVSYPAQQQITYGTPLLNNLNATCSVPAVLKYYTDASFSYQVFNDTILPIGNYTIYAVASDSPYSQLLSGLTYAVYSSYSSSSVNFFDGNNSYRSGTGFTGLTTNISSIESGTNNFAGSYNTDGWSIQWIGLFKPNQTGVWTFYTNSDDGSFLWIGSSAVSGYTSTNALVQNGGAHSLAEKSGSITLTAGVYYDIRIQYFDTTGTLDTMIVAFQGPDGEKRMDGNGFYFSKSLEDTIIYNSAYTSASLSVVAPQLSIVFPKTVYVVLNDTLASFISATTVSPSVPGTFAFFKNNSSGAALTSSSVFDAVGSNTIFCQFTPTDTVTYQTSSSSSVLVVQDKDVYNSRFDIPVTDTSNVLVNGNFQYLPARIASGTSSQDWSNIPGWTFTYGNNFFTIYNNVDLSSGIAFPYPFGTTCIRALGGTLYQSFYCVAGTYSLSFYAAVSALVSTAQYVQVNLNETRIYNINNNVQLQVGWQKITTSNFTISTTGMHRFRFAYAGGNTFYLGNFVITPVTNQTYLKPSKINSLISNGVFETEIQTANSKSLTPLTNWTTLNNAWVLNNYSIFNPRIPTPYPSGNQCVALEGLGKITQTFTATASSSNFLSFYVCSFSDTSVNQIRASINGTVICDVSSTIFLSSAWTKMTYGGITTIAGTNTLTIEGMIPATGSISAIDNVIFGQVLKEAPVVSFGPKTDYQYIPIQNNTVNSNKFTATGNGAHPGLYEFTASSSHFGDGVLQYFADGNLTNYWGTSYTTSSIFPPYATGPYSGGNYVGATDPTGLISYFFKTDVTGVGTVSGEWIQIKLPYPIQLTKYGIVARPGNLDFFPLDYYLLGSVDGLKWYSISRVTNSPVVANPTPLYWDVSNNTKLYSFYRFIITKTNGFTYTGLSELSLFGDNTKNYYGTPIGANLNASFDISGAYTYFLDASLNNQVYPVSTLPVGNQTIYTRYISNDTVDYNTSFANTTLTTVAPPSYIVFPQNVINVVSSDTLADFMSKTSVYPSVPGSFTFMKVDNTDSSIRTVLTASSTYGTAGKYTLYVSFAPDDYLNNQPCFGIYTVTVQDTDAYNNYFNIPVTDLSNVLVNGKFEINQYADGTQNLNPTPIPGWRFFNTSYLMNNNNYGLWTFPPPYGKTHIRLVNATIYQVFYAIAGTYTFTMSYCNTYSYPNGYVNFLINGVQLLRHYTGTTVDWTTLSYTFTLTYTGLHDFRFYSSSNNFFFGNIRIVPVTVANQISYLKFSKIDSRIFNGTFETEITLANSKTLTPLTNWTIENNRVWVLNNYTAYTGLPIPYPSGNQCIGIEGLGKISQTFNHVDSSLNYLSFYICAPIYFSASSNGLINPFLVKINNVTVAGPNYYVYDRMWTKCLYTNITTIAGPNTLSIEGTDTTNSGKIAAIDNVIFGSINMSPTTTTYAPSTIVKYGSTMSSIMTATCNIPATITYYLDSALTNQIFADSTLPVGDYQVYVKSVPLDIYNYMNSFAGPASISVVNPNPIIQFPKIINVVYNETLANLINYTTVVPSTPGTLTFRLNNSSGAILTTSNTYNVIGKFTVFCTFTPDDTATYETTSATYNVTVEDNDAPNNYFNIPVTDTTNLLVNGNFEYIPATYPPGTNTSNQIAATPTNIPGWRFFSYASTSDSGFVNDVSVSTTVTYPFPNGPKSARLRGARIFQPVFLNAGTYTFSCYVARQGYFAINSYFVISLTSNVRKQISAWNSTLQAITDWYYYSTTFTVSTTTTYQLEIWSAGSPRWYFQKMSIVPTYPNPQYLKFSKIESQIFNGSFETEIKTANSISTVALSNWTKENTVWVLNNYSSYNSIPLPYPSGNQCVAIEKTGKISQTFTYTASKLNYLSFYVCGDASSNPLTVKLNDVSVCTISPCSSAGGTWQKYIYPYLTTVDGTNALSFEGTNQTNGYIGIDNVILGQVNRAVTTVTFPTPAPIMYGTDLSAVLVATGSVPGSFQYFTDSSYTTMVFSNSLLIPSMYSIYAVFTPSDQVNYMQGFAAVDLSVNKLVPSLTYETLPAIDYGTLLESSLKATTNVPSKVEYYLDENKIFPVNGLTVLAPGTYTIYAFLNPTDTVTYSSIMASSSLTVNPSIIRPTMYYPSLIPITYGTNLTNKLNASIVPNLPGTIRYYTDASYNNEVTTYTILQPGIWTLYAVFTPTDSTECTQAFGSTSIFVSNLSIETRKLVLSTSDILASTNADDYFGLTVSNAAGIVENNRYTYTWYTNIRNIMGDDFYNRYSKFSIRLKDFVNGDLFTTAQPSSQNLSVHYEIFNECKLSGVQFDPAPRVNGVSSNQATLCVLTRKFPASSPCYYNVGDSVGGVYTFSKTTDTVPIKIDLPNLYDDQYFAPSVNAVLFGHLTFVFEIRGVLN
jgi:hypothetical protein